MKCHRESGDFALLSCAKLAPPVLLYSLRDTERASSHLQLPLFRLHSISDLGKRHSSALIQPCATPTWSFGADAISLETEDEGLPKLKSPFGSSEVGSREGA
jgi:hypothetical protein